MKKLPIRLRRILKTITEHSGWRIADVIIEKDLEYLKEFYESELDIYPDSGIVECKHEFIKGGPTGPQWICSKCGAAGSSGKF